jgi:NAD(P)-dependent dehydrogenase (short-subunit alcohol dehydrogenase family)
VNTCQVSLEGKVAVVSGGSRGIGAAGALTLAGAGADVVAASRKLPDLEQVAEKIRAKGVRSMALGARSPSGWRQRTDLSYEENSIALVREPRPKGLVIHGDDLGLA